MARLYLLILCLFYSSQSIDASTDCRNLKVQPIDQLSQAYLKGLDRGFYKKFVSASGIPIMGPSGVSDYALQECARIVNGVLKNLRPGFLPALKQKLQRVALWASNSNACSIPETAKPCDLQEFKGGLFWGNILILQETSFDCDQRGNAWIGRVLVHEFNHAINSVFDKIDASLQKNLVEAYNTAKTKGYWPKNEYAMVNDAEYFAIGGQTWFEANEQRHCDMDACNRGQLQKKDPGLYGVVSKVYREPNWLYKCDQACDRSKSG